MGQCAGQPPSDIELDVCLGKMKMKKAPGVDDMMVEMLKHGGLELRQVVYELVREMWRRAIAAEEGHEADAWPEGWVLGTVVPLWKKKGNRKDKNTWRGVTLLSVGV